MAKSQRDVFVSLIGLLLLAACDGRAAGVPADAAGVPADAAVLDAVPDGSVNYCPLDVTDTAEASGYSPLGVIDTPLAWMGYYGGECGGMRLVLVPDRETFEPLLTEPLGVEVSGADNALVIHPRNWDPDHGGWLNTGELWVEHHVAGETVNATGLITITSFTVLSEADDHPEQSVIAATFVIDATGWSVSGWIEAIHCANLDILCV